MNRKQIGVDEARGKILPTVYVRRTGIFWLPLIVAAMFTKCTQDRGFVLHSMQDVVANPYNANGRHNPIAEKRHGKKEDGTAINSC